MICPACAAENAETAKFCSECGVALAAAPAAREQRKIVTVLFCDLSGSTALGDRTDPEALRATMRGYYEQMRTILERHGGTVEKFVGDAVMAVFGVPVAHEDDALRAVRAAWEMRAAVPELGLNARIGVNTGEVVAGEGDTLVTGDAVNVAARLEQAADVGDVLIGAETRRLVRDAVTTEPVEVEAKGKPAPFEAFRLQSLDRDAPGVARRLDTRLVGRERELRLLEQAFERSAGERSCHLVTVLGPAGVGKSRLVAEFLGSVDATVVRGRCLDYGEGITFWPVIEVLKQLGAETTVARIAEGAATGSDLMWEIRTVLEEASGDRPLVVVFDDIHWGEPTFLDLIDHVSDLSRDAPILLLCVARPELLELRPGWGGGKLNATTTLLESLSAEESGELLTELDDAVLDAPTRERILQAAAGNPLFLEEMLAHAREGGDVRAPSTIQALLQARLDRLGRSERAVIEGGAVEGEVFHRGSVNQLVNGHGGLDNDLVGLVRKELIRPDLGTFPGENAFRFRHLLIRDAAYEALPKETRADLHARFADWLAQHAELVELDEVVGYHLEQAARYRAELGRADPELAARAGRHLAAAGHGALARGDFTAVITLLGRAVNLLPEEDPVRERAALALAETAASLGERELHDRTLASLLRSSDPVVRANARVIEATATFHREPEGASVAARAVLEEVLPILEAAGDSAGLARAEMLEFYPCIMFCEGRRGTAALRRAISYARLAGDRRTESDAVQHLSAMAGMGSGSASELEEIAAELERVEAVPSNQAGIAALKGLSSLLRGDIQTARRLISESVTLLGEIGWEIHQRVFALLTAVVELHAERPEAAAQALEASAERLLELGVVSYTSTLYAYLAVAYQRLGRIDDALATADRSTELSAADDVINFTLLNGVRARIAADRGQPEEARAFADEAWRWAGNTDFWIERGGAYLDLAYVLTAGGDSSGARDALQSALAEFRIKEDQPMIAITSRLLAERLSA